VTTPSGAELRGETQVPGVAHGQVLVLVEPLSFWGGVDVETGVIIDKRHPQVGTCLAGRILVMQAGRGSSSSSSVLAEAIRNGSAPAGIILQEPDLIIALGACVAATLYAIDCPVVTLAADAWATLRDDEQYRIEADDDRCMVRRE
jgi:predicted aconitase with swiveling domain